jgi:hypothetical protein
MQFDLMTCATSYSLQHIVSKLYKIGNDIKNIYFFQILKKS